MKLDHIVEKSFALLGKVLNETTALENEEDIRRDFVYRHACNIRVLRFAGAPL